MQPGLNRALPMSILGFLAGALLVTLVRALQGLEPVDAGLVVVFGTLLAAFFFMWGMGAFDPRMSQHPHEPEDLGEGSTAIVMEVAHDEHEEADEAPTQILGGYLWVFSTIVILVFVLFGAIILIPGMPVLVTTTDPIASPFSIGFVEMELGGQVFYVSQLLLLVAYVVIVFLSLGVFAGGLGFVFFALNSGITEVQGAPITAIQREPVDTAPEAGPGLLRWGVFAVIVVAGMALFDAVLINGGVEMPEVVPSFSYILAVSSALVLIFATIGFIFRNLSVLRGWLLKTVFVLVALGLLAALGYALAFAVFPPANLLVLVLFNAIAFGIFLLLRMPFAALFATINAVLFALFYFVLIGLVLPGDVMMLYNLSLVNSLVVTLLVLRPKTLSNGLGSGSRWLAFQLRRLPNVLQ